METYIQKKTREQLERFNENEFNDRMIKKVKAYMMLMVVATMGVLILWLLFGK